MEYTTSPQNFTSPALNGPFMKMRSEIDGLLNELQASPHADELEDELSHLDVDSVACETPGDTARTIDTAAYALSARKTQLPRAHYVPSLDLSEVRMYSNKSVRTVSTPSLFTKMLRGFGLFCLRVIFVAPFQTIATIITFVGRRVRPPKRLPTHFETRTETRPNPRPNYIPPNLPIALDTATISVHPVAYKPSRVRNALKDVDIIRLARFGALVWVITFTVNIVLFATGLL